MSNADKEARDTERGLDRPMSPTEHWLQSLPTVPPPRAHAEIDELQRLEERFSAWEQTTSPPHIGPAIAELYDAAVSPLSGSSHRGDYQHQSAVLNTPQQNMRDTRPTRLSETWPPLHAEANPEGYNAGSIPCPFCAEAFATFAQQRDHCHRAHTIQCPICNKKLMTQYTLYRHISEKHNGEEIEAHTNYVPCELCGKYLDPTLDPDGRKHMTKEHPSEPCVKNPLVCQVCQKLYYSASTFRRHVSTVHQQIVDSSIGAAAMLSFSGSRSQNPPSEIETPNSIQHSSDAVPPANDIEPSVKPIQSSKGTHVCLVCGKTFGTKSGVRLHVNAKHSRAEILEHTMFRPCELCGAFVEEQRGRQLHMFRVHRENLGEARVDPMPGYHPPIPYSESNVVATCTGPILVPLTQHDTYHEAQDTIGHGDPQASEGNGPSASYDDSNTHSVLVVYY